jgi:transposase-like protein
LYQFNLDRFKQVIKIKQLSANLFSHGLSIKEIHVMLINIFDVEIKPPTIRSNVQEYISKHPLDLNTSLESYNHYVIYVDVLSKVINYKKIFYTLYIAKNNNHKKILFFDASSKLTYDTFMIQLQKLKIRGLINPRLFVIDYDQNLKQALLDNYPQTKIQFSLPDYINANSKKIESIKLKTQFKSLIKSLISSTDLNSIHKDLTMFVHNIVDENKELSIQVESDIPYLLSFLEFDLLERKSLYTNNLINHLRSSINQALSHNGLSSEINDYNLILFTLNRVDQDWQTNFKEEANETENY